MARRSSGPCRDDGFMLMKNNGSQLQAPRHFTKPSNFFRVSASILYPTRPTAPFPGGRIAVNIDCFADKPHHLFHHTRRNFMSHSINNNILKNQSPTLKPPTRPNRLFQPLEKKALHNDKGPIYLFPHSNLESSCFPVSLP